MDNIQHKIKSKKNIQRFLYSYVTLFIVSFFSLLIILETIKFVEKKSLIKDNTSLLRNQILKLDKNIEYKKTELENLNSEDGKEEYFRVTLPVAAKGEKVFILYNSTNSDDQFLEDSSDNIFTEIRNKLKYFIDNYTNL